MIGTGPGSYIHDGLFYGSQRELLDVAVPFLRSGLAAGETGVVACADHNSALLRSALDGDPRVDFLPRADIYRRVPGAIAAYRRMLKRATAAGTGRVRLIGEVDFGHGPADWAEWGRFEAVVNRVLTPYPMWSVCMYDTRRLPDEVLKTGKLTHPNLVTAASRTPNSGYLDPAEYLRRHGRAQPDPLEATDPTFRVEDATDLAELRRQLHARLTGSALEADARSDFVYAISEVATNGAVHGRPPVEVRVWSSPARSVCVVTDSGAGFDDPFAGYTPTDSDTEFSGRGLWLARQLCDHVSFSTTAQGFAVRLALWSHD